MRVGSEQPFCVTSCTLLQMTAFCSDQDAARRGLCKTRLFEDSMSWQAKLRGIVPLHLYASSWFKSETAFKRQTAWSWVRMRS